MLVWLLVSTKTQLSISDSVMSDSYFLWFQITLLSPWPSWHFEGRWFTINMESLISVWRQARPRDTLSKQSSVFFLLLFWLPQNSKEVVNSVQFIWKVFMCNETQQIALSHWLAAFVSPGWVHSDNNRLHCARDFTTMPHTDHACSNCGDKKLSFNRKNLFSPRLFLNKSRIYCINIGGLCTSTISFTLAVEEKMLSIFGQYDRT